MSAIDNATLVQRGPITTPVLGTPGSGLSGPEQFDAYFALARNSIEYLTMLRLVQVAAQSGGIPRLSFATGNLRAASEAASPPIEAEPTHTQVAFALTKTVWHMILSNDTLKFAVNGSTYQTQMTADAAEAWFLDLLRLLWIGDPASADPSLSINTGWLTQVGNTLDGSTINSGDFTTTHLTRARQLLPSQHHSNLRNMVWCLGANKKEELIEVVSQRATGFGDEVLKMADDGSLRIYGRPTVLVDALDDDVVLVDPRNTIAVADTSNWAMFAETGGVYKTRDVTAITGFLWIDPIMADTTAAVRINNLN
jgi:hypothetical protein